MIILKNKKKPCVALVADNFTADALMSEVDVIQITPSDWRWKLRFLRPDFLFVESTWRGYKNSWKGKVATYVGRDSNHDELRDLVCFCKEKKIKTIFWNKEDPFHFERFSNAATLFDAVYTTDSDSVKRYHSLPNQDFQFVGVLMFAAQHRWYQSVPDYQRLPGVSFFGGYYGNEFKERSRLQEEILNALSVCGLVIYDRFWIGNKECSYPKLLHPYCRPAISSSAVVEAYRKYQVYLNFNTAGNSPTMLSRRVFELGASGCAVISSPSLAMTRIFHDSIISVLDGEEARFWCEELQGNIKKRRALGEQARDIVLSGHTWKHRLIQLNQDLDIY